MIKDGDIWLDASPIKVGATDGKITLTGSIGSAAEKTRARTLAWVMGVNDVDDQGLKVEPWLAEKMRQATDKRSRTDDEISWNDVQFRGRERTRRRRNESHQQVKGTVEPESVESAEDAD